MYDELSTLTTIPVTYIKRIFDTLIYSIGYEFMLKLKSGNDISEFDIGIGKLIICIENNEIKYKFIPSDKFEKELIDVYNGKESLLVKKLEESLSNKAINSYKELF